jgi:hypothetical protein
METDSVEQCIAIAEMTICGHLIAVGWMVELVTIYILEAYRCIELTVADEDNQTSAVA